MSERLSSSLYGIEKVPYVGKKFAGDFKKLGVETVKDLLLYKPRTILNLSHPIEINKINGFAEQKVAIAGKIEHISQSRSPRKKIWVTTAKVSDDTGLVEVRWFNQPFLGRSLHESQEAIFYGQVEFDFYKKNWFVSNPEIFAQKGLVPIYALAGRLSNKIISRAVKNALGGGFITDEFLPDEIIKHYGLLEINDAVRGLHFPETLEKFRVAKKRLIFAEVFVFVLANLYQKKLNSAAKGYKIASRGAQKKFLSELPFELTQDQKKAISDINTDLVAGKPSSRLIQGDVGSGKTVVGLAAAVSVIAAGNKAVWLAPTEILALQHFETAKEFLHSLKIKIALVTSETKRASDKNIFKTADLLIGTHALLQKDIQVNDLALVIVDEQHRFGVGQRAMLSKKDFVPHFISLSATPIPRSLGHIIFGNLDISIIKSKPKGRMAVKTYLISESKRQDAYKFIKKLIDKGQQVFVVCPLIETKLSGNLFGFDESKTVESELMALKKTELGSCRIEKLHGKMKSAEKAKIMSEMKVGKIDVLVCTSVVEVGVDIPGATVMLIEDADKFGLAQLHQFRGRIGRNDLQSYCFVFSNNIQNEQARERLKMFVRLSDGFDLSEADLKLRGPGAVLGLEQSGFGDINPLWLEDSTVLKNCRDGAQNILSEIEKFPKLFSLVKGQLQTEHLE